MLDGERSISFVVLIFDDPVLYIVIINNTLTNAVGKLVKMIILSS